MPASRWGGSEELWAAAARYALEQKHEVFISAPSGAGAIHKELIALKNKGAALNIREERDKSNRIEKAVYKAKRMLNNIPQMPSFYYEFSSAVKNFNPDFICVNQGGVFNVVEHYEVVWLLKNSGKPYFLIGQSNLEHKVYPYKYLQRIREIYKAARKVYFISHRNLDVAKRQLATADFKNYQVVKNPCRIENRRILDYPADAALHFAVVGRLECRNKGLDILFQVLSAQSWQNRDWILNIYGTGDDLDYLRDLAAYFGINDNVKFHGWASDVSEIWKTNHMLLMPSIEEGTPLALIEAMAYGRTAVVTDVGGNAELICEGENGFVAEAATAILFSAALERAWDKRGAWKELGAKAHESVEAYIDPQPGKPLLESMLDSIQ